MRKMLLALVLAAVACLTAVSVSAADTGPIQVSGQSADTSQQAAAASGATQTNPSNTNISIRVLSPGNDGNVSQTNAAGSSATAGNASNTGQGSSQTAGGGGVQSSNQSATTDQLAGALSTAAQSGASNTNVPIRVLSPGNDGNVSQTNAVGSQAAAGNAATTGQAGTQTAGGGESCGCTSSTPIQTSDQSASTDQEAAALSHATQNDPSNTTVSVRVLSPGDGGSVSQTNAVGSSATAGNLAGTSQSSRQSGAGTTAPCGCSGTSVQQADQSAATDQGSAALSAAAQASPSNEASPVRVGSSGNGGAVSQQNVAGSHAAAINAASTSQQGSQAAGSGHAIQVASQDASTEQGALAASAALQQGASNDASPVRVNSNGNDGSVSQANAALSSAVAANKAGTSQTGNQTAAGGCQCSGTGIQVLGQKSETEQAAFGASEAIQLFGERSPCGCSGGGSGNNASPVRVGSSGDDGTSSQANAALSSAAALNGASTRQDGSQSEAGGGLQIQALGQQAETEQDAAAASLAAQIGASNDASPVRVNSPGGGGSARQANVVGSSALAGNESATGQAGRQSIAATPCGCRSLPIQVAGQSAETEQAALALSAALQAHPSNRASPTRVWSPGGGGSVSDANAALSRGAALNGALTSQGVIQTS
jgi:hypothetical protein